VYRPGAKTGKEWLKEEDGGGERSRKDNRWYINRESRIHELGFVLIFILAR
jgi:hypothetical protein